MSFFLLRLAVGLPFLYAGVDGLIHEDNWIGFIPQWIVPFLEKISPASIDGVSLFLYGFSGFELALS